MSERVGTPDNLPDAESNSAQLGLFSISKVRVSSSGSEAVGWNRYSSPMTTDFGGLPEIDGAPLLLGGGGKVTTSSSPLVSSRQPVNDMAATIAAVQCHALGVFIVISHVLNRLAVAALGPRKLLDFRFGMVLDVSRTNTD
jgi:hypothetical protein